MPALSASRSQLAKATATSSRDGQTPAKKKIKLSGSTPKPQQNGYKPLLNGASPVPLPSAAKRNGAKNHRKDHVNEASVAVGGGIGVQDDMDMKSPSEGVFEVNSGEEDSEDPSSDSELEQAPARKSQSAVSGSNVLPLASGAIEQTDIHVEDGTAEPEDLTFGERLQAQEPDPAAITDVVDVEAAFAKSSKTESGVLTTTSNAKPLGAPSAASLGSMLTQALRTNDQDQLDTCLGVIDVATIYNTVERLPSQLVGNLLQKLAERLHKRPGRAGMLMVWVQWSLAAHGGYLASQPQLVKQLATLNKVLKERACGLQPLLSLKGRLDMLHAQLELRKRNQRRAAYDEEDEAVIYVEGEDDGSSEDESDHVLVPQNERRRGQLQAFQDDEDESSGDDMPTTMAYHEEDESDEEGDDSEGVIDDEAEETDNDTGDDMSEPASDDEIEEEGMSESDEETKPVRRSTAARAGLSRRF